MHRPTVRLVVALLCTACAAPSSRWASQADGTAPSAADSGDCRQQAQRHAELRFPRDASDVPSRRRVSSAAGVLADTDRSPAENDFYAQCMRRKGFELIDRPPRS